ncbi:hypothetical protein ACIOGT_25125 [Streptomyces microflavus]|uniref:hypothetical protein n=1 Tax=Streptomyces microflavus TaxID=1919 RepID=UPI0038057794
MAGTAARSPRGAREAFPTGEPELVRDAAPSLGYGNPVLPDLPVRTLLARLLHLYEWALTHHDQPMIGLVDDLRRQ